MQEPLQPEKWFKELRSMNAGKCAFWSERGRPGTACPVPP